MSYYKVFATAVMCMVLAACSSTESVPDPEPTDTTYGGADTSATDDGSFGAGEEFGYDDGYADEVLGTVIYFEFDSSEVRAEDQDLVAAHAIQLNEQSFGSVRLEGHADERGSREYNIGLGRATRAGRSANADDPGRECIADPNGQFRRRAPGSFG